MKTNKNDYYMSPSEQGKVNKAEKEVLKLQEKSEKRKLKKKAVVKKSDPQTEYQNMIDPNYKRYNF